VKPLGVACAELAQWGRPWCSNRTLLGCGERKAAPHKKLSLSLSKQQIRGRIRAVGARAAGPGWPGGSMPVFGLGPIPPWQRARGLGVFNERAGWVRWAEAEGY
jgi:hypothetical protein